MNDESTALMAYQRSVNMEIIIQPCGLTYNLQNLDAKSGMQLMELRPD